MKKRECLGAVRAGVIVVFAGALAACGGTSGGSIPNGSGSGSGAAQAPSSSARAVGAVTRSDGTIDATIMHGARAALEFRAQPGAACTFPGMKPGEAIYADVDGMVRTGLRATRATASQSSFVLTCRLNGSVVKSVPVWVNALSGEAPQAVVAQSAPRAVSAADVAAAKTRLGFDFATASKEELIAHDLPPRPDAPDAYAGWLRVVTSPTTRVVRSGPPTHRFNQATGTSPHWSGYSVNGNLHEFSTTSGEWHIPQVSLECGPGCKMSMWEGVGGSALVQDGSASYLYEDTSSCSDTGCGGWALDGYYVWYEYYPANEVFAFSANANDDLWCESWLSTPTSNASGGSFYCKDNTTGWVLATTAPIPNTGFYSDGATVSWIVEAPLLNGATQPLPNFGNAYMWGAYAATTSNGQWFGYSQRYTTNYTLQNGNTVLSTAAPWSGNVYGIAWTWHNYN